MKKKKLVSLLLALALSICSTAPAFAEELSPETEAAELETVSANDTVSSDATEITGNNIENDREYTQEEILEFDRRQEQRLLEMAMENASEEEVVSDAPQMANGPITPLPALDINDVQGQDGLEPFSNHWVDYIGDININTDLSKNKKLAYSLTFSPKTQFSKISANFDRDEVIEWGRAPGLGVDILHKHGFDGTGSVIAYIDQPIKMHEEYKNVNLHYTNNSKLADDSMHGPVVLSLLAGKNIGTAPGAEIYFYGIEPSIENAQKTEAESLYQVIEQNKKLPEGKKIRMVGFSDNIDKTEPNVEAFREAAKACEDSGVMVWFCGDYGAASFAPESDKNNPNNVYVGNWWGKEAQPTLVFVPTAGRTAANNDVDYIYWSNGGLSWSMPYAFGLYADALAIDPTLTKEDLRSLIVSTATMNANGLRLINPVEFIATVLERVGRNEEAASLREDYKKSFHYFYAVMNKSKMTQDDIKAAENYLQDIKNVTVLEVDASSFRSATDLYSALKADAGNRGGITDGIQIFGTPDAVPTFVPKYKVEMKLLDGTTEMDEMGELCTDLFYGNFKNKPENIGSDYNVYAHFTEGKDITLTPEWPVARLPLKNGQFSAFLNKYDDYAIETRYKRLPLVNFCNPIFRSSDSSDCMATFLDRAISEFKILKDYRLYANLLGDYPLKNKGILGGFTAENLTKENKAGINEFLINSHGQPNNIDKCWFENGEEKRESLVNSDAINTVFSDNPYYLDCWTCNNGYRMDNNLTTTALNGNCLGVFSATTVISNNGVNCKASLEDMKKSNFYWFYYNYLKALNAGLTRAGAFYRAQAAYADALIADSANALRGEGNYQFNMYNLLAYHNFGLIEPKTTKTKDIDINVGTEETKPGTDDPKPETDNTKPEIDETDITLIPGELRRLNFKTEGLFTPNFQWKVVNASPKGCVTVKNGVVTAKKAGTATITGGFPNGDTLNTFTIKVDGTTPEAYGIADGKKKISITASTKSLTEIIGNKDKKVAVKIPAKLRDEKYDVKYEILNPEVCKVSDPVYNKADRKKATAASFAVTPLDAGATYIVWTMEDESGNKTQAYTKVIVKKPATSFNVEESVTISQGKSTWLTLTGLGNNTDAKAFTFTVKGKGIAVNRYGEVYVCTAKPAENGVITVKFGKIKRTVNVKIENNK